MRTAMQGAETGNRRVHGRAVLALCSAVAALAACGGADFANHPPRPKLGGATDFGSVPVGSSKELLVFLGNGEFGPETYQTLQQIVITVEGPELSFDSSACPSELPQAGGCAIRLVWAPSSAYMLTGQVRVLSNAPTSPTMLALSGASVR